MGERERMAMNDKDPQREQELDREREHMSLDDRNVTPWTLREIVRMQFHGERPHEHFERIEMEWEDFDVTDEVNWRRNVRPRLELEQDCIEI